MIPYRIEFAKPAIRQLAKLPRNLRQRISDRIETLAVDPRPAGCKKLVDTESLYRLHEGDYRIIYQVKDDALLVLIVRIGHRGDVYRNLPDVKT
ncbi:MAG: type II toxin-antitoxin system RelE/ParE family toxin [Syntrophobacteraceae bacterium]